MVAVADSAVVEEAAAAVEVAALEAGSGVQRGPIPEATRTDSTSAPDIRRISTPPAWCLSQQYRTYPRTN